MTVIANELVEAAVDRMPVDAMTSVRKAALAQFAKSGFPTVRDEDWKYTNLGAVAEFSNACLSDFSASMARTNWTAEAKQAVDEVMESIDANWIIVANGITALETLSKAEALGATGHPNLQAKQRQVQFGNQQRRTNDELQCCIVAGWAPDRDSAVSLMMPGHSLFCSSTMLRMEDSARLDSSSMSRPKANIEIIEAHISIGSDVQFEKYSRSTQHRRERASRVRAIAEQSRYTYSGKQAHRRTPKGRNPRLRRLRFWRVTG